MEPLDTDRSRLEGAALRPLYTRLRNGLRRRPHDADFFTDSCAAALQGSRPSAHWILWATLLFVVTGVIWAAVAEIDEVTVGQGKVIPSSKVQVVQNLEGGIVADILVEAGQLVRKGQPLMRIDDTRFSASYREGAAKDDALRARIARLEAEATLAPFRPPVELERDKPQLLQQERTVYASRRRDLDASLAVLQQQLEQRTQELAEIEAHASRLEDSYTLISQELTIMREAAAKGIVPQLDLVRIERQANDIKGELEVARLSIPRRRAAEQEVKQKAAQAAAEFRAAASRELSEARAEQSMVSATRVALEDRLARTTVRAPVSGTIKQVKVNTVGGVVQPGMDLIEIVPLEDTLLVEAHIRPADIAFLRPGLDALVKLTAYDFSIYGGLEGRLEHVSADAIVDERPGAAPASYYVIRVRTARGGRAASSGKLKIIPGMQATVDIRTGRRTVLQYLLKPVLRAKQAALRER